MTVQHLLITSTTSFEIVEKDTMASHIVKFIKKNGMTVGNNTKVSIHVFDDKKYAIAIDCSIYTQQIDQLISESGISPIE